MFFRATARRRGVSRAGGEGRLPALRPVPTFRPVPFKQEKFLSMKSRTAGGFFSARQQILKRSAEIISRVEKLHQQQQEGRDERDRVAGSRCGGGVFIGTPLTSHVADEIDAWNRSVMNLEAHQGFVLTDEMVYGAVSKNIRVGAFPYVLDWLQKAARERRVPVPTYVLGDVRAFIDFVQSVLPTGNMSLMRAPETLLGMMSTRDSSAGLAHSSNEADVDEKLDSRLVNASPYVGYLFKELYIPVWECLVGLGLLPPVRSRGEADLKSLLREQREVDTVAGVLGRVCCCDCGGGDNEQPTALRAYTGVLLALAQCAAEAKEFYLLFELQLIFCILFVEQGSVDASKPFVCRLNRSQWCRSREDEEILCLFANDFLAAVYYGRLAYQNEMALDRCVRSFNMYSGSKEKDDSEECGGDHHLEEEEGDDNETETPSLASAAPSKEEICDETVDPSLSRATLQGSLDELLRDLIHHEEAALRGASMYAALVLEDATLLPSDEAHYGENHFSEVEVQWMRLHCDICRRCRLGECVAAELEELFRPGGVVAQGLEATSSSVTDQQCFLALAVETAVTVAATLSTQVRERQVMTARVIAGLLDCLKEAQKSQSAQREEGLLLLPLYSAASAMVLLYSSLITNATHSTCGGDRDEGEAGEEADAGAVSHEELMRLLHGVLQSVLDQPAGFGNVYSAVLLVLAGRKMWEMVRRVLDKMDTFKGEDGLQRGVSSVQVDQRVWAWLFQRARDAGEADICLLLRENREKLFY